MAIPFRTNADAALPPVSPVRFVGGTAWATAAVSPTRRQRVAWAALVGLLLALAAPTVCPGQTFTLATNFTGLWGELVCGDFDNDGRLDLIASGIDASGSNGWVGRVQIYRNLGNCMFAELAAPGMPAGNAVDATAGDYNNDGNVDLLSNTSGTNGAAPGIFRGLGDGTFSFAASFGPPVSANSVSWGDLDNDGDPDVLARAYLVSGLPSELFRNDGGTFASLGDPLPATFYSSGFTHSAAWCDYNQDGFADVLGTGNPGSGWVRRLFRNNRDGTFTDIGIGFSTGDFAWGDYDNDGDPDLLIGGNEIYRNDGNDLFTSVALGLSVPSGGSTAFGDFNNDGWLDILVTGDIGGPNIVAKLFRNNAGGSFIDTSTNLLAATGPVRCADFDNDGDLDFAVLGLGTPGGVNPVFRIYRNNMITKNVRPNPPGGLTATTSNLNTVLTLRWNAAVDSNQAAGLTYNLRVGTQSGASDVFSAVADPTNGFRRVVADGNCGGQRSRTFTNFPAGVYYWSVQAIDHSYAGSAFAAEASFTIAMPTLSDIPDQAIFPDMPASIPFVVSAVGTPLHTLSFSAVASDNTLVPTNGFAFLGSGNNRTLVITPARNRRGTTTVTVTVTDTNGATATDSFELTVRHAFTYSNFSFPAGGTAWGDYDNDGFPDLLLLSSPLRLYRNNGGSNFTEVSAGLPADLSGGAVWGDYNHDGLMDLALSGWTGSGYLTAIFRNTGSGAFTNIQAGLPQSGGSLAWGDYDNDGDLDLLIGGSGIWRNDHGIFALANTGLPVGGFSPDPWGDYDRDGFLDLLLGTSIFRNNGNGTFTDIQANLEGVFGGAAGWGDHDGDGYLDVAIIGFNGPWPTNRTTRVYRNNRDHTFTDINAGLWPLSNAGLAWGDFDNDGWLDLAITGTTNYMGSFWVPALAYHNNGDGTFNDTFVEFPGGYGNIQWIDYDADGALDLLVNWADPNWPRLFHNDTPKKNTPPAPPTGLAALIITNNNVLLAWQAAADNETTNSAGLNYDLRVGTTTGGIEIASPPSDPGTGRRRLAARGGIATNSALLRDFPPGTYFWSVQAVDPGFIGSPFSTEGSFVISNARPDISGVATQIVSHGILSQPIAFVVGDLETPASLLAVTASSSNTNRIANEHIFFSGSGSNRLVQLRPRTNQPGPVTITVTVMDEGGWTRNLDLLVIVTNAAPQIAGLSNITVLPGLPVPPVSFVIGDAESSPGELSVLVSSSNTNLVANSNLFLSGAGSNRVLQVMPSPGSKGVTTIRVVATDALGAMATNSFVLRISAFDLVSSGLPDVQQGAVDWGDFDNDGDLDVLICGRLPNNSSITRVYRNNGNGTFTDIVAGLPGVSGTTPPTASWGDFNGDGHLDILLVGGGVARVYRNQGNGTFTDIAAGLPASSAAGAWFDCDNDGDLDIVLAAGAFTAGAQPTRIYRNDGGAFTNSNLVLPQASFAAPADYDNDGDVDLALGGVFEKQALVTAFCRNDGQGRFSTNFVAGVQGVTAGTWSWADADLDGWLDLLVTGLSGNYSLATLLHNHTGSTFTVVATNLPGINAGTGVWGDYDNDGRPDIFMAGVTPGRDGGRVARLYRNDGSNNFAETSEPFTAASWSAAAFGDYDADGRLDLLHAGTSNGISSGAGTFLAHNLFPNLNTPPAAPAGLDILPGAILSWDPATNAQTTNAAALTYNLRIGTNAGGSQIMSPHADTATGRRRVARPGNAGAGTRWRANLPPGTYYWSVQAVDPAFAGSAFAPENVFTILGEPARIVDAAFAGPGQFRLRIQAAAGASCRVLVSQDLSVWTIAGHVTEVAPGQFEFLDSPLPQGPRFYRLSCP